MALSKGTKQLNWLQCFIQELSIDQSQPTSLWSDNLSTITLSQDATDHACTKHINVAYHFIHENVASHEEALTCIPMKENTGDILTKGLELHQHQYLMGKLGYGERNFSLRGSVSNHDDTQSVLWTDLLKAVGRVTKSIDGVVGGTWFQLMCCALPKCLCP